MPLVEAVGHDQAAPTLEGVTERGLLDHGLGARVDEPAPDAELLGPGRHQAPAHEVDLALGLRIVAGI